MSNKLHVCDGCGDCVPAAEIENLGSDDQLCSVCVAMRDAEPDGVGCACGESPVFDDEWDCGTQGLKCWKCLRETRDRRQARWLRPVEHVSFLHPYPTLFEHGNVVSVQFGRGEQKAIVLSIGDRSDGENEGNIRVLRWNSSKRCFEKPNWRKYARPERSFASDMMRQAWRSSGWV